ncbi:MAG TPA: TetR/AcrR family transcriptional regulator [Anaerovoracaceae bacterium]|nr:TetR/AcrR family transcriptional regulator [Anaerovoracaceae bacterium]
MDNLSKRDKEKLVHEKEILTAAEKIFCRKGYEASSMDEIAKEAQLTKRTVYQYFENKDDLYFAIVLKGFNKLFSKVTEANKEEQTGYEMLESACRSYYQFYRDNPDFVRLMNYWGHVRRKSTDAGKNKNELVQFNNKMIFEFKEIIEKGKGDGSIQYDLDSEKTALCLIFLITGFFNQLSATGDNFTEFFSLDQEDFSINTMDLVIKPLKRGKTMIATRKGTV